MTYKSRQYSEKDGHKLMKAIIAQKKSYSNEQERKRKKKSTEMNSKTLLGGIEGNDGNEMNNIDLVMASNTQVTQDHNNNNNQLCGDSNDISKKVNLKSTTLTLIMTQKKIDGTTVMNATIGRGGTQKQLQTQTEQNVRQLCL